MEKNNGSNGAEALAVEPGARAPDVRMLGCSEFLERLSSWSKIVEHVRSDPDYRELPNPYARRQHERTLKQMETGIVAVHLVMRHYRADRPYTLGELASILSGEKNTSAWKSAQQRLKLLLSRLGDHYGLIDYSVVVNPRDGQSCYRIAATRRLVSFVEEMLLERSERAVRQGGNPAAWPASSSARNVS